MTTTFPIAEKVKAPVTPTYELKDAQGQSLGIYKRLKPAEAKLKPAAIRANLGKSLVWFEQVAKPEGELFVSTAGV